MACSTAEEEASSDSECSFCPGDDRNAAASTKGGKSLIEGGNFDVLISARCKMGFDREMRRRHNRQISRSLLPTLRVGCQRRASSRVDDTTTARRLLREDAGPARLLIAPRSSRLFACGDHSHVKVRLTETGTDRQTDRHGETDRERERKERQRERHREAGWQADRQTDRVLFGTCRLQVRHSDLSQTLVVQ